MRHLKTLTAILALVGLALLPQFGTNAYATAPVQDSREQAGLAEEQEVLLQQLRRLIRTMEVLQQRFIAEERTQAAKLLREGIDHLGLRDAKTGSLTLDELMNKAREDIAAGQTFSALQRQERVIQGVTRLLSILMDRKDVEDLNQTLQEIKQLEEGLEQLASEERELQEETAQLREDSANEAQKKLQEQIDQLAKEQRELLAKTESKGMKAGTFDLERIERELEKLIQNQETDVGVMSAWRPDEQAELSEIEPMLEDSRAAADRAERLQRAAEKLREAAAALERGEQASELTRELGASCRTRSVASTSFGQRSDEACRRGTRESRERGPYNDGGFERSRARITRSGSGETRERCGRREP